MLNQATFNGRLVSDPELKLTQADSTPVTSFRIAVQRDYAKDKKPETDFFDIVAWRGTAEFICKYFKKGSLILVTGRLQNREWTDKNDQKRTATELIAEKAYFGDSKEKDNGNGYIDPYEGDNLPTPLPAAGNNSTPPANFDPFS